MENKESKQGMTFIIIGVVLALIVILVVFIGVSKKNESGNTPNTTKGSTKSEKAINLNNPDDFQPTSTKDNVTVYSDDDYEIMIYEKYDEEELDVKSSIKKFTIHDIDVSSKALTGYVLLNVHKEEYYMVVEWGVPGDVTCGPVFNQIQIFNYVGDMLYSSASEENEKNPFDVLYTTWGTEEGKDTLSISYNAYAGFGGCENGLEDITYDEEHAGTEEYAETLEMGDYCDYLKDNKAPNEFKRVLTIKKGKVTSNNLDVKTYINDISGMSDLCSKVYKTQIKK